MKFALKISLCCLLMMAMVITWNNALARTFPIYLTSMHLYNLGNNDAGIVAVTHNDGGIIEVVRDLDAIPAGGTFNYLEGTLPVTEEFSGALTFVANQKFASIVNIRGTNVSGTRNAYASYTPPQSGSTTVSLPLLFKQHSGFSTWYRVQNLGSGPATINISYSDGTALDSITIPTGGVKTFNQDAEAHSASVFAGTITSDEPISAVVIEESTDIMYAYTGFAKGAMHPVFPLVNYQGNGEILTGIQLQNIGTQSTEITITYTPGLAGTDVCSETIVIAPESSATFALYVFHNGRSYGGTTDCPQGRFVGSAKVTGNTANQPLVGIANQLNYNADRQAIAGEAYGSFDPDDATDQVALPIILDSVGGADGFYTGFSIQNIGENTINITCEFNNNSNYGVEVTGLAPGSSFVDLQKGKIRGEYIGSAICIATGGTETEKPKIIGVVNQLEQSDSQDLFMVYEAIPIYP